MEIQASPSSTRLRVYDLPLRIFHWSFAAVFLAAFGIAKTVDDESPRFLWHMLFGIGLGVNALLRIVWGFTGTRHSRFLNFPLHPRALTRYVASLLKPASEAARTEGHNPASSWLTLLLLALALALAGSGILMSQGYAKEFLEEAHEVFSTLFILGVIGHLSGLALHTIRHRDPIGLSMLDGKKHGIPASEELPSTRPWTGLAYLLILATLGTLLVRGFDPKQRVVRLGGLTVPLGFEQKRLSSPGESPED